MWCARSDPLCTPFPATRHGFASGVRFQWFMCNGILMVACLMSIATGDITRGSPRALALGISHAGVKSRARGGAVLGLLGVLRCPGCLGCRGFWGS